MRITVIHKNKRRTNSCCCSTTGVSKQQGTSLYISVMILFLITTAGLTIFSSSLLNQKISTNYVHKNISYQAVENVYASLLTQNRDQWQAKLPEENGLKTTIASVANNTPGADTTLTITYLNTSIPNASQVPNGYPLNDLVGVYYQADVSGQFAKANSTHRMNIVAFVPTGASGSSLENATLTTE